MATSQAKALNERTGLPVLVLGPTGRLYWSEVFENNPRLVRRPGTRCAPLRNAPGYRPYIAGKTPDRFLWRRWDIRPGELYFSAAELAFAEPYRGAMFVEPHTKVPGGNKAWPFDRWQAVVDRLGTRVVQTGQAGSRALVGAEFVETTFRQAAAVLSVCRAFAGAEGAMHHAAAAVGVRSVVLWSEFISPEFTGYASQRNIRHAGAACGARVPCKGCRASMDAIAVDEVYEALAAAINAEPSRREEERT
jgi:hypothetical protein